MANRVDIGLLMIRLTAGVLMVPHGYTKLVHFAERKDKFMDFLGLGGPVSLALVIFAEFFCSILLAAGFLSRLTVIPLIIAMFVAVFIRHNGEIFGDGETGFLFLTMYSVILLLGGGRFSADKILLKK